MNARISLIAEILAPRHCSTSVRDPSSTSSYGTRIKTASIPTAVAPLNSRMMGSAWVNGAICASNQSAKKAAMTREGNLDAPTRHALDWRNPDFYDEESLYKEMERIFGICHGCRRCVSLCGAFPTLGLGRFA